MSETGATNDQLLDAAQRLCGGQPEDVGYCWPDSELREFAAALVPPGYQITKVGAVVLSAEEAELGADGLSRLIARYESLANEHDRSGRTEQWLWEQNNAAKFSALAAKLSGGAS